MKKFLSLLLIAAMVFSLAACGDSKEEPKEDKTETIEVDEGLINVDITIPASFFEGKTDQDIEAAADEAGHKCVINEDGSVTYTMTKKQQKEALQEMKDDLDEAIHEFMEGEEPLESFEEITYNDDLTEFTIKVNEKYGTNFDTFASIAFLGMSSYYQMFAGVPMDEMDCVISYVDYQSGEVLDSSSLKEMQEGSN